MGIEKDDQSKNRRLNQETMQEMLLDRFVEDKLTPEKWEELLNNEAWMKSATGRTLLMSLGIDPDFFNSD